MADLVRRRDIFNPNLSRGFFDDDFLSDTFFHRSLPPPVNISEGEKVYTIEVSAPGAEKENIKIKRQKILRPSPMTRRTVVKPRKETITEESFQGGPSPVV